MTLNDVIDTAERVEKEEMARPGMRYWSGAWQVRDALLKHMGEVEFASWDCSLLAPTSRARVRAPAHSGGGE